LWYRESNIFALKEANGLLMSSHGISGAGRAELAAVAGRRRFIAPADVAVELGVDRQVAARRLAHWAEKGWLRRVRRGLYIPVPVEAERPEGWSQDALVVAAATWSPCYFTGWTAASHWGLTEQMFRTTVVKTTQRVRRSEVRLLDSDYLLMHVAENRLAWGMRTSWNEDVRLQIADPTRTVVDILDTPRIGGGIRHAAEILDAYLNNEDSARLIEYAERLGNRAVFKRLGYLTEALGCDEPELIAACRARLSAGIVLLDPDAPQGGPRTPKWGLRANVRVAPQSPS
jgi:predicted transcriptional regulator of viral defense system